MAQSEMSMIATEQTESLTAYAVRHERRLATVLALVYPRIASRRDPFFPSLDVTTFESHAAYLRRHYTVINESVFLDALAQRALLPDRSVLITVDGAYEELATVVEPVIRALNLPVLVFAATACVGAATPVWTDELASWIKHTSRVHCEWDIEGRLVRWHLGSVSARLACASSLQRWLRRLPDEERRAAMRELSGYLMVNGRSNDAPSMLTWPQMAALRRGGLIAFGAQTRTAPVLSRLAPGVAAEEIRGAKEELERHLQEPIAHFAYPGGRSEDFHEQTVQMVKDAGYAAGWTAVYGANTAHSHPWRLCRVRVTQRSVQSLAIQLAQFGYHGEDRS